MSNKRYRLHFDVQIVVNDPQTDQPWSQSGWVLAMKKQLEEAAKRDAASTIVDVAFTDVELEP